MTEPNVELINQGSYGCIFRPGFNCKGKPIQTKKNWLIRPIGNFLANLPIKNHDNSQPLPIRVRNGSNWQMVGQVYRISSLPIGKLEE